MKSPGSFTGDVCTTDSARQLSRNAFGRSSPSMMRFYDSATDGPRLAGQFAVHLIS